MSDEEILAIFGRASEEMRATLELYGQAPKRIQEGAALYNSPREAFFWGLTLELGISVIQAELAWVESVIERIKNKQHPAS